MNGQADFTVKAEPEGFKDTLFVAMELSRATWLVATFAPRLGDKISVLDGASLPIDRRAKHIKTDNIDAKRLLRAIVGFVQGDPQSCRVVRAPTPEEEDARRLHRERQRLVRERTGHS